MTTMQALAIYKSIRRHHPFFRSGGKYGHDFRTMGLTYPNDAKILLKVITLAQSVGY